MGPADLEAVRQWHEAYARAPYVFDARVAADLAARHVGRLLNEVERLQDIVKGLADRVAAQSELLTQRAERKP